MSKTNSLRLATNLLAAKFSEEKPQIQKVGKFVFDNLTPEEEALVHLAAKSGLNLAGTTLAAAAFQPIITVAFNCSTARAFGLPMGSGWQNLKKMSLGYGVTQTSNMFKNRFLFSLLPATIADAVAEIGVSPMGMMTIHASIKSGLVASVKRDVATRFHAVNAKKYDFINEAGNSPNLMKLREAEFYEYAQNSPNQKVQQFGRDDWLELQQKIKQTQQNFWHQATTLTMRNLINGAAAFAARPIAQMMEHDLQVSQQLNMDKKDTEEILTQSVRLGFAWLSTPFDRAFTFLSAGKLSADQVYKQLGQELIEGNFGQKLFLSGASRTFTCFLAAISLGEGPRFAKFLVDNISDMEGFKYEEWQKSYADKKQEIAEVKKKSEESLQRWNSSLVKPAAPKTIPDNTVSHPKIDEKFSHKKEVSVAAK